MSNFLGVPNLATVLVVDPFFAGCRPMTCSRGVGSADLDTDYLPCSCQHRTAQYRDCVGTQVDLATLVDLVDQVDPATLVKGTQISSQPAGTPFRGCRYCGVGKNMWNCYLQFEAGD